MPGVTHVPPLTVAEPLVSICLYVRNGARTIAEALDSAVAQSYPNKEIVVVDGASTDGTQDIIRSYAQHITTYISEPDSNAAEAANKALRLSRGDVVVFLMADDWLHPMALVQIAQGFAADPAAMVVSSGVRIVEERPDGTRRTTLEWNGYRNALTLEAALGMPMSAARYWRRDFLIAQEGFNLRFPNAHDRDLLVRCCLADIKAVTLAPMLYTYRSHPGSNTLSGNPITIRRFLAEHRLMAQDWLKQPGLSRGIKRRLQQWQREQIAAEIGEALKQRTIAEYRNAAALALRHPGCLRALLRLILRVIGGKLARSLGREAV